MTDIATRPAPAPSGRCSGDAGFGGIEARLLAALRRARWDDGSPVVDTTDRVLKTRVVPHLTAVVATEAAGLQPTEEVLRHA